MRRTSTILLLILLLPLTGCLWRSHSVKRTAVPVANLREATRDLLVREPNMLRMIGLFPVVRNKAFDMVSDGERFKLSIPTKNKFIEGSNEVVRPSANALENLRPQVIFNALLLRPI